MNYAAGKLVWFNKMAIFDRMMPFKRKIIDACAKDLALQHD
jgi:hypothetical protein